jgi:hypothetical protein
VSRQGASSPAAAAPDFAETAVQQTIEIVVLFEPHDRFDLVEPEVDNLFMHHDSPLFYAVYTRSPQRRSAKDGGHNPFSPPAFSAIIPALCRYFSAP